MAKLKIRNFGPIQKGFSENDGFLEISPVTVICGNQATGKSTIAKLYSIFSWLEKANVKSGLGMTNENTDDLVSLCKPHRIDEYFNDKTEIHYIGTTYEFIYQNGTFSSKTIDLEKNLTQYKRPKIMYVPAERNLLTSIEDAENIKVEGATTIYRTNKIILKNPRPVDDEMALHFYKISSIIE